MIRDSEVYYESVPWMKDGNCTDPSIDPEWFFPESEHYNNQTTKVALKICSTCPVKRECLEYALSHWPIYGIWGGLRTKQLKELAKQVKENNERSNNN